jgi:predicted aminopeptidase
MGRLTDLELLDTHDGRSRQLKQRMAEVRKELEAAHGGSPLERSRLLEIAKEMDRLIVEYTKLAIERTRQRHY